jgi:2-haloacid dehalogenase
MADRFAEAGAPAELAKAWFATLLRDGFALTAAGDNGAFADIGAEALRVLLAGAATDPEILVERIMAGLTGLGLHPDVEVGVRELRSAGYRLVTLTNGSVQVAEKLFGPAGLRDQFERLLSVEDAPLWKPARAAYDYAAAICRVAPEQMLLVAAHPWDIHGAARAGLSTAWINRTGARYPDYFASPDVRVASLTELATALGSQG